MPSQRLFVALAVFVIGAHSKAQADQMETFRASGSFNGGQALGGTITVNTTTGGIKRIQLTVNGFPTFYFIANEYAISSSVQLLELVSPKTESPPGIGYPSLTLLLPASLVNYSGGAILPTATGCTPGNCGFPETFNSGVSTLNGPDVGDLVSGSLSYNDDACGQMLAQSKFEYQLQESGTAIEAIFVPPEPLAQAATDCGYIAFNWQQQITNLPLLPNRYFADSPNHATNVAAPPQFFDPPEGGYYDVDKKTGKGHLVKQFTLQYPYYWQVENAYTGDDYVWNLCAHEINGAYVEWQDRPRVPSLQGRETVNLVTSLVGVLPDHSASAPLAILLWKSNWRGGNFITRGVKVTDKGSFDMSSFSSQLASCQ